MLLHTCAVIISLLVSLLVCNSYVWCIIVCTYCFLCEYYIYYIIFVQRSPEPISCSFFGISYVFNEFNSITFLIVVIIYLSTLLAMRKLNFKRGHKLLMQIFLFINFLLVGNAMYVTGLMKCVFLLLSVIFSFILAFFLYDKPDYEYVYLFLCIVGSLLLYFSMVHYISISAFIQRPENVIGTTYKVTALSVFSCLLIILVYWCILFHCIHWIFYNLTLNMLLFFSIFFILLFVLLEHACFAVGWFKCVFLGISAFTLLLFLFIWFINMPSSNEGLDMFVLMVLFVAFRLIFFIFILSVIVA
jgi:hypothetical protein